MRSEIQLDEANFNLKLKMLCNTQCFDCGRLRWPFETENIFRLWLFIDNVVHFWLVTATISAKQNTNFTRRHKAKKGKSAGKSFPSHFGQHFTFSTLTNFLQNKHKLICVFLLQHNSMECRRNSQQQNMKASDVPSRC